MPQKRRIFIDPGHGGTDPGAVGALYGTRESDVNRAVGHLLAEQLRESGFDVSMSRVGDESVSLGERVRVANEWKADIFISIHCNAAENSAAQGIETWYYTQDVLADTFQQALLAAFPDHRDRGTKKGSFYVLKRTVAPAVLIEMEFVSNQAMEEFLIDPINQAGLANAIGTCIEENYG